MRYAESNCSHADSHCKKVYVLKDEHTSFAAASTLNSKREDGRAARVPLLQSSSRLVKLITLVFNIFLSIHINSPPTPPHINSPLKCCRCMGGELSKREGVLFHW